MHLCIFSLIFLLHAVSGVAMLCSRHIVFYLRWADSDLLQKLTKKQKYMQKTCTILTVLCHFQGHRPQIYGSEYFQSPKPYHRSQQKAVDRWKTFQNHRLSPEHRFSLKLYKGEESGGRLHALWEKKNAWSYGTFTKTRTAPAWNVANERFASTLGQGCTSLSYKAPNSHRCCQRWDWILKIWSNTIHILMRNLVSVQSSTSHY